MRLTCDFYHTTEIKTAHDKFYTMNNQRTEGKLRRVTEAHNKVGLLLLFTCRHGNSFQLTGQFYYTTEINTDHDEF